MAAGASGDEVGGGTARECHGRDLILGDLAVELGVGIEAAVTRHGRRFLQSPLELRLEFHELTAGIGEGVVDEVGRVRVLAEPVEVREVPWFALSEHSTEELAERELAHLERDPDRLKIRSQDLRVAGAAGQVAGVEHGLAAGRAGKPSRCGDVRRVERIDHDVLEARRTGGDELVCRSSSLADPRMARERLSVDGVGDSAAQIEVAERTPPPVEHEVVETRRRLGDELLTPRLGCLTAGPELGFQSREVVRQDRILQPRVEDDVVRSPGLHLLDAAIQRDVELEANLSDPLGPISGVVRIAPQDELRPESYSAT